LNDLAVDFSTIFSRPASQSYFSMDLLRLYKKFFLYDQRVNDYVPWFDYYHQYINNNNNNNNNKSTNEQQQQQNKKNHSNNSNNSSNSNSNSSNHESESMMCMFLNTMCVYMNITDCLLIDNDDFEKNGLYHHHHQVSSISNGGGGGGGGDNDNKKIIQIREETYEEHVPHEQMHQSFTKFLSTYFGDDHKLCKLLKCVDQAFVVALLGNLAESLFFCKYPMRFKDLQGTWNICVRKNEEDFSFIHRRREQGLKQVNNALLAETFQFSWELEFVSNNDQFERLETMHVRLIDLNWKSLSPLLMERLTEEEKIAMENEFRTMFTGHDGSAIDEISQNHMSACVKRNKMSQEQLVEMRKQALARQLEATNQFNSTTTNNGRNKAPQDEDTEDDTAHGSFGSCSIL